MKLNKLAASLVFAGVLVGSAQADSNYASLTYDVKDKQNSEQMNYVYGLNVGQKFDSGFGLEVRMEDERVEPGAGKTQKQEGLLQVKAGYDISTGTFLTPYLAVALGHKNKATIDFNYWVAEVGAKVKFGNFGARYGVRQRTAFDNNATNSYDTKEHTVAVGYNLTKQDNISFAYKIERGTSDYNTKGVYYTRNF